MQKNVASQHIALFAFDATTGLGKSGDGGNITPYVSKDYGTVTALGTATATEMDSTNAKGWYSFVLTQAETDADALLFTAKSSTSNISIVGQYIFTTPNRFSSMVIDAAGIADANAVKIGPSGSGAAQSARDIGASDFTATMKTSIGTAVAASPVASVTGNVGGSVVGNVPDSSGTTTLLSRLSAARAGYLDNLSAGAAALEASLQGLITTIGASAAGIATAVWSAATRVLTAGTNIVLVKGTGITGFTDLDAGGVRGAVGLASANLDTQVGTLSTSAALSTVGSNVSAIKAKTDNLTSAPADETLIISATNAIMSLLGSPTGASLSDDVAAVKGDTASTKAQTDKLTFTVVGKVDSNVRAVNGTTVVGNGHAGTEWGPA